MCRIYFKTTLNYNTTTTTISADDLRSVPLFRVGVTGNTHLVGVLEISLIRFPVTFWILILS